MVWPCRMNVSWSILMLHARFEVKRNTGKTKTAQDIQYKRRQFKHERKTELDEWQTKWRIAEIWLFDKFRKMQQLGLFLQQFLVKQCEFSQADCFKRMTQHTRKHNTFTCKWGTRRATRAAEKDNRPNGLNAGMQSLRRYSCATRTTKVNLKRGTWMQPALNHEPQHCVSSNSIHVNILADWPLFGTHTYVTVLVCMSALHKTKCKSSCS